MREEEEPTWFTRWEDELPSPEELMPLSQSLIPPNLALAFNISNHNPPPHPPLSNLHSPDPSAPPESVSEGFPSDEPARTLKRPRLVWTPQLHKRFVDAVAHIGIKNAVPKTIMQLMSVGGLTRENVASHLQKYRLYLKRMQGLSSSASWPPMSAADAATEQLFASSHIPHPFLCRPGQEQYMQFISPPQMQYYDHMQIGNFGSGNDHGFLARGRIGVSSIGMMQPPIVSSLPSSYGYDLDSRPRGGGRRVLTLFPTGSEN